PGRGGRGADRVAVLSGSQEQGDLRGGRAVLQAFLLPAQEDGRARLRDVEEPGDDEAASARRRRGLPLPDRPGGPGMKTLEPLSLLVGVLLLGWLLYRIGWTALWASLSTLGWGFLLVFALQTAAVVPNTLGWRRLLPPEHRDVPFPSLAAMLLAGNAIHSVTPSAMGGGELVRASLLRRYMPAPVALGATGNTAMAEFFAQILFIVTGVPVALPLVSDPDVRKGLLALAPILALVLGFLLVLVWSRSAAARLARRLEAVAWLTRVRRGRGGLPRELADATFGALRRRPGDFAASVGLHYAGWLVGAAEVALILALLRAPVSWRQALAIETLSIGIQAALFFVPGRVGVLEGGKYLIFHVLGLD